MALNTTSIMNLRTQGVLKNTSGARDPSTQGHATNKQDLNILEMEIQVYALRHSFLYEVY